MTFEFLEDITLADIAFKAKGKTIDEMFVSASQALLSVLLENYENIKGTESVDITLSNNHLDMLLCEFLNEFLYYKDAHHMLYTVGSLSVTEIDGAYVLSATLVGETIDLGKHRFSVDIKAVTMHNLETTVSEQGCVGIVVVDV